MGQISRYPDGALWRHDPDAVFNFAVEDASHGVDQLRLAMLVPRVLPVLSYRCGTQGDNGARDAIDIPWHG